MQVGEELPAAHAPAQLAAVEQAEVEPPDADRQGESDREAQARRFGMHPAHHHAAHRFAQDDDGEQPQPFGEMMRVRGPVAEPGHRQQRRQNLHSDGGQVERPAPFHGQPLLGSPGDRRHREADDQEPREAACGGYPEVRVQVEQRQHHARRELGAGEGGRLFVHAGLHEHGGAGQREHQEQRQHRLQDAAVVEAGGVGGVSGPHQEQRQVERRDLAQRFRVGMSCQVMREAGDVDDEDQVEEQLEPGRRPAFHHLPAVAGAVAQRFSHWVFRGRRGAVMTAITGAPSPDMLPIDGERDQPTKTKRH